LLNNTVTELQIEIVLSILFLRMEKKLFIHPKKTEYVIFGTAMKLNQFDSDNLSNVYLGGQVLSS